MPRILNYPAQLIVMVEDERKARYKAEAEQRGISIGDVVRELLDAGERQPLPLPTGAVDTLGHPVMDAFRDGEPVRVGDLVADSQTPLADYAASLGPDTEADDNDDELAARIARLRSRGLY